MRSNFRSWIPLVIFFIHQRSVFAADVNSCPGYTATNVQTKRDGLTANLVLASNPCNVFGQDVKKLLLEVEYETAHRIHVKITDPSTNRYEVPQSVLPRPKSQSTSSDSADIQFHYTTSPFSFSIRRKSTKEVLFDTSSHPIVFEPQYLRVKTNLPSNANIYGLGEHSNSFRLPNDATLTMWSRDAAGIPGGTNLYGNHPVYFEHRTTGTHGVFFLNSNGMDVKLSNGGLEYNAIGGVLDFYFLAGSETDPSAVARQYAQVVGLPAEVPYWSFGLHQCRFGYKDFVDVANVITNYKNANIPLETMWTDIDYMDRRRVFTLDPKYFPLSRMREIVSHLHANNQRFILMTDPAVPYLPSQGYAPYDQGHSMGIFMKRPDGKESLGVVWPGVTVYPDWFHPDIQRYWSNRFASFYSPSSGLDIDGAWIDMNEPSNFCQYPCNDPSGEAARLGMPPPRRSSPPNQNAPIFKQSPSLLSTLLSKRRIFKRDVLNPPYAIHNAFGALSSKTAAVDIKHANGLSEYDTHNLYGTMMSMATQQAMSSRRPGKRTFIITRSTFAGAGAHVGKWLGDNRSNWNQYRNSIANMLGFATIYQMPMVGSDICGFLDNTNEALCARWASLGAFYPFMRNHNADETISQEFYLWQSVAQSARNAIDIRYRLLDYIYTAFHQAHLDGTPVLHPLWFKYPKDQQTYGIQYQFFYGDSILVSPVVQEGSNAVSVYLPRDIFYDFKTLRPVEGTGSYVQLGGIDLTQITVHIKGGAVLPLRVQSAMTTTALRKKDFELVVAPDTSGRASGKLYVDDGESVSQSRTTQVQMTFDNRKLTVQGSFGYSLNVDLARVRFLNVQASPRSVTVGGQTVKFAYDSDRKVVDVTINRAFNGKLEVEMVA